MLAAFVSLPNQAEAAETYKVPEACNKYVDEAEKYDWNVAVAIQIMYQESRCNPNAQNRTDVHKLCRGSFGLMQISCDQGIIYDPAYNIKIAYEQKYKKGGWKHWSVCKNGKVDCGLTLASRSQPKSLLLAAK